jgi:hypothetical protein
MWVVCIAIHKSTAAQELMEIKRRPTVQFPSTVFCVRVAWKTRAIFLIIF